jgi:leader peptidase (prepilin peptidase) / N-methyltransferase
LAVPVFALSYASLVSLAQAAGAKGTRADEALQALSPAMWMSWWAALGLFVGSFLNVAIHRLPLEGETISKPRRSRCPSCKTTLTWKENIPLLSWIVQRGRCRTCGWRIPWRYPLVEALNSGAWALIAHQSLPLHFGRAIFESIAISGLIVATFVDFDCFEIPDEVSIGGMLLAPIAVLLVPEFHEHTWIARELSAPAAEITRLGALTGCLAGMIAGGGILWLVGKVGSRMYGRDAMGFGDVKLLAAGGGFIGPGGVLVALMAASLVASVAGIANMARFYLLVRARARSRGGRKSFSHGVRVARIAGRYVPFGPYLALGIGIVLLYWTELAALLAKVASG